MTITIRPMHTGDEETAYRLMRALGYDALDRIAFQAMFQRVLDDGAQTVFLGDRGGQAIALMSLSVRPQLRLGGILMCIDELVVTDEARGSGVGRMMLNEAKAQARRHGAVRLELHTRRTRESYARGFYVKNGFVEADSAVLRWTP